MAPDTTSRVLAALPAAPGTTVAELTETLELADSTVRKTLTALAADGHAQRIPGTGAGRRRSPDRWAATAAPTGAQPTVEPANEPDAEAEVEVEAPADPPTSHAAPDAPEPAAQPTAPDTLDASDTAEVAANQPPSIPDPAGPPPQAADAPAAPPAAVGASAAGEEPGSVSASRLGRGQLRDWVHQFLLDHADQEPGGFGPAAIGKHLGRSQGAVANALDKLVTQGLAQQVKDKPRRFVAVQDPPAAPQPAPAPQPQPAQDAASPPPAPAGVANGQAAPPLATPDGPAASAPQQPAAAHAAANGTTPTATD